MRPAAGAQVCEVAVVVFTMRLLLLFGRCHTVCEHLEGQSSLPRRGRAIILRLPCHPLSSAATRDSYPTVKLGQLLGADVWEGCPRLRLDLL